MVPYWSIPCWAIPSWNKGNYTVYETTATTPVDFNGEPKPTTKWSKEMMRTSKRLWISNTRNYFYDNVAAASQRHGYWVETRGRTRQRENMLPTKFIGRTEFAKSHFPGWEEQVGISLHPACLQEYNQQGAVTGAILINTMLGHSELNQRQLHCLWDNSNNTSRL